MEMKYVQGKEEKHENKVVVDSNENGWWFLVTVNATGMVPNLALALTHCIKMKPLM